MRRTVVTLTTCAALAALPSGAASASVAIPPPHCDPAACPNPVEGIQDCVDGAVTAIRYILQGTPQPQECDPLGRGILI